MNHWHRTFLCIVAGSGIALVGTAREVEPLRIEQGSINGAPVSRIRIPVEHYEMQVVGTRSYSFEEATLSQAGRKQADSQPMYFAVLSAGFSRNDPLEPSGGLIEDRDSYSPFNLREPGALTGVLCVDYKGKPRIFSIKEFQVSRKRCSSAVQAGPFVVERDGSTAINPAQVDISARLVACIPREQVDTMDFYYFTKATLPSVEAALKPRCMIALNLTGSIQAGMTVWEGDRMTGKVGRIDTPIPSMILILSR